MATNNKYDRQLRLWGAAGQRALAETCVILIRATAAGTETLKNLVLPGIGSFVIWDDATAGSSSIDYSSNFFVPLHKDTSARAASACEHLQELNPDVSGSFQQHDNLMECDFESLFHDLAIKTTGNTSLLVIASDLEPPLLERVAQTCSTRQLPLIAIHSYGLIGAVRLQTPPLPIMNSKPRDAPPDLRLMHPFPTLCEIAASVDYDALENHIHSHVPFPLILLRVVEKWKQTHQNDGGSSATPLPRTFVEKQEFQTMIQNMSRNFEMELNFQEAKKNAYLAYAARELDLDHLASLREQLSTAVGFHTKASPSSSSLKRLQHYLAMLNSLDEFLKRHENQPPLNGTIPDMTASTDLYIQLQEVYRKQAEQDLAEFRTLLPPGISDEENSIFCQNLFSLDLLCMRSLQEEYHGEVPEEIKEELAMALSDDEDERPDQIPILWYLGFRACQLFYKEMGRYPGVISDYEQDVEPLQKKIVQIVQTYGLQDNALVQRTLLKPENRDYATELTRYGNAEIHNVASVVGGVASQEAVKIITGQYVPIHYTYVYNGIVSSGGVYKF